MFLVGRLFLGNCLNRVIVIINHPLLPATLKTHWLKMTHTARLLSFVCHLQWLHCYFWLLRPPKNSESYFRKQIFYWKVISGLKSTLFENQLKCPIWIFEFWHFPSVFVLKLTCLVTLLTAIRLNILFRVERRGCERSEEKRSVTSILNGYVVFGY